MKRLMLLLLTLSLVFVGFSVPVSAKAPVKVSVCHIDENGNYKLLSVSEKALKAHLSHGDNTSDVDQDGILDCVDPLIDSDGDGVADDADVCPGEDDTIDENNDGIPDCTQSPVTFELESYRCVEMTYNGVFALYWDFIYRITTAEQIRVDQKAFRTNGAVETENSNYSPNPIAYRRNITVQASAYDRFEYYLWPTNELLGILENPCTG